MPPSEDTATQRGQVVQANGVNIYYESHGQGRPLVLIHAGTLTGDSWQPYLAALAAHYRVITPDIRAHGRSNLSESEKRLARLAAERRSLVQADSDRACS